MGYGKKIYNLLQQRGLSVAELSRMTNIKPTTLYSIIDNDSSDLKIGLAYSISNALNIPFSELVEFPVDNSLSSLLSMFPDAEMRVSEDGKRSISLANLRELKPYFSLNSVGRKRALEYIEELNKISDYTCK